MRGMIKDEMSKTRQEDIRETAVINELGDILLGGLFSKYNEEG